MTMVREEIEARVRRTFDTVASSYDHPGASWFDQTARALVAAAGVGPSMSVLDLATGTGKVALALAASEPRAHVVGLDLSPGMLSEARRKAKALELANVAFEEGSFDDLNYGPRFDVLTCSFGIFFVEHMAETLARFGAQLKSGGRLLLSTFQIGSFEPMNELFMRLFASYGFETPPPPWLRIASNEGLEKLFVAADLPAPSVTEHDFSFDLPDAEAWWDIVYNAGYRGMLQRLAPADVDAFQTRHLEDIRHLFEREGNRRMNVRVLLAATTKP